MTECLQRPQDLSLELIIHLCLFKIRRCGCDTAQEEKGEKVGGFVLTDTESDSDKQSVEYSSSTSFLMLSCAF